MASRFTHLHTHSHYSLLNALPKIPELIERAKSYGMDALALTDNGNLYGAIEFYKRCKDSDIRPIIGVDFYVALRTRHDKQAGIDNKRHRLVLLAETTEGYFNLIKLVTESHFSGFYYKPRVDHELLEQNNKGLIAIIPSFSGETSDALRNGNTQKAHDVINWYKNVYGESQVFLEITHHPEIPGHEDLMKKIVDLGNSTNTPLIAAHDTYYLDPEDAQAREVLISIQSNAPRGFTDGEEDFSFIDTEKAERYFKDLPEALENTQKVAERCNIELSLGELHFPHFQLPSDTTAEKELTKTVYDGIERRGLERTSELEERIEYELNVIRQKGYAPYFLVVQDLIRFARENGIPSTIRGSVAGSMVTYLSGITNLNPFEYKLRFERFLNPERPSAPDIDMDFADNRRDEVIQYARDKYGTEHVAQIGTFGTMMARGAVRDVARALGHPYALGDQIAKLIPMGKQGFPMTINRALEIEDELSRLYKTNTDAREVIDMAKKVEGCARHISVHAAGVVIAPGPLSNFTPTQPDPKGGKVITQFDMRSIEEAGLPKFDFLGLKNLAIIADTVKRIKWRHNKDIDIESIPLDDEKTFEMLSRGETHGTFQLNGSGMTRFLKELRPTTIHDINAMVALYRPGPMDFIPEYIARKNNPRLIDYPHESLKEDLERSFGLLIYQEDVMYTAIKLAGYSWLDADKFRKAMGKKIPELMEEQEEKFKSGCVGNGIDQKTADNLWERIKPFAAYAFNKSHAASYGRVAYQTSYLKANYPLEYMAAILTADAGDTDKISETINECGHMNIGILPPDINESFGTFTVVDTDNEAQIRFGLYSIKNFGEGIADVVIEERKENGVFTSLENFLERIQNRNLNRKTLESLIKAGALDQFGSRESMLASIDGLLEYNKECAKRPEAQESLFGGLAETSIPSLKLTEVPPVPPEEKLKWERELLGIYLSGHPLDRFRDKLESRKFTIRYVSESLHEGMTVAVAGVIDEVKIILTKKGKRMAFVRVADFTEAMEVVVFPDLFEKVGTGLEKDICVAIEGKLSKRKGETSVLAEKIKKL